jgi:environmental stress-induced protein Ves
MAGESFDVMRRRVLRKHKYSIVRSALRGHMNKGRGLVYVKFTQTGKSGMVHLSFLTLDTLKHRQANAGPNNRAYRAMIIEKVSGYQPDSQIPVMVTDGECEQFSFGVKQAG